MSGNCENVSEATVNAVKWIDAFMRALGEIAPDVQVSLIGQSVSARIDVADMRFSYEYDPKTTTPALSAQHFLRNAAHVRRAR
jgi:hypothetical protein